MGTSLWEIKETKKIKIKEIKKIKIKEIKNIKIKEIKKIRSCGSVRFKEPASPDEMG